MSPGMGELETAHRDLREAAERWLDASAALSRAENEVANHRICVAAERKAVIEARAVVAAKEKALDLPTSLA